MPEPVVTAIVNGSFVENCFLVGDAETRDAVLVDPGEEPERFLAALVSGGWTLRAIWLTHAHVDHVLGIPRVKAVHDVPILLHPADRALYDAAHQQAAWFGIRMAAPLPPPDGELAAGQVLSVGAHRFTVRHTPGHSPGSVSFVGEGRVLGGDVLFQGSIGRTDLPGGDFATLLESIRREFLALPDATIVHAGHGPDTTVGAERRTNPFLAGAGIA